MGQNFASKKKFVFPPPHSWLGIFEACSANKDTNQPLRPTNPYKYFFEKEFCLLSHFSEKLRQVAQFLGMEL